MEAVRIRRVAAAAVAFVALQLALAGCGLGGAHRAPATPSATAVGAATASATGGAVTVASATYGPGVTIGALTVAHVITPAVSVLGTASAPLRLAATQFVTDRMGWAVGSRCPVAGSCQGVLLATQDGGATWSERVIASTALTGLQFLDTQNGWAYGADALYATANGGVTWSPVALPAGLRGVSGVQASFVNPTDGWLVVHLSDCGGQGCGVDVYATADGGATWRRIASDGSAPGTGQTPQGLSWSEYTTGGDLGGGHGWMLARLPAGVMQTTADGGRTWTRLQLDTSGLPVGGGFASDGAGWAAATSVGAAVATQVWSSADGGAAWRRLATVPGRVASLAASADGASAWVALQGGGVSVISALGGATAAAPVPAGDAVVSISALDGSTAWAVASTTGGDVILATTNGGHTWRSVYRSAAAAVMPGGRLWGFEDGSSGWAVGAPADPTALLRTADGGASWTVAGRVPVADATSAGFSTPTDGWVADPQAAYLTADGGATWTQLRLPLPKGGAIAAMGFPTAKSGWLLPAATKAQPVAHLLVTADGGARWTDTGTGPFLSVAFATARLGWAVGRTAGGEVRLLATTNGGLAWAPVADLGPQQWNPAAGAAPLWVGAQLAAASPDDVWLASGAHLLQSIDGGHTWVELRGPAASGLAAAAGGYLWVRAGPALYSVTAGGRRWTQVGWAGGGG